MARSDTPADHQATSTRRHAAADESTPIAPTHISTDKPSSAGYSAVVGKAILIGLMHIVCSAALILYNKYLMRPDKFPFAIPLSTLHMATAFALSGLLWRLVPTLFPSAGTLLGSNASVLNPVKAPHAQAFAGFLPIGACFAASIVTANAAYQFASVCFLQMVKESVVLWVYLLNVSMGGEVLKRRNLLVLCFVTCCAALAVSGEAHFLWPGLLLQVFSSFTQATQAVITGRVMSAGPKGLRVDPLTMVLGSSPVALVLLLPANYCVWNPAILKQLAALWPLVLGNALAAFALQVVNAVTIRELSATGLALAAVLKDLVIIGTAAAVLHENLARLQVVGFSGAVVGISLYSTMKLRPDWFEPPPLAVGSAAQETSAAPA